MFAPCVQSRVRACVCHLFGQVLDGCPLSLFGSVFKVLSELRVLGSCVPFCCSDTPIIAHVRDMFNILFAFLAKFWQGLCSGSCSGLCGLDKSGIDVII